MIRRCRPLLGTFVEIAADSQTAVEAGFAAVARVHRLMSAHERDSEISRLNRSAPGAPVQLSSDTLTVVAAALSWAERSGGRFDPLRAGMAAVASGALPRHSGQPAPTAQSCWQDLTVDGSSAWLGRPGCIDLGGIAKGHALDVAAVAMRAAGARSGLINAGGDMIAFGVPQRVTVVDPSTRRPLIELTLENEALATSGALPDGSMSHLPGAGPALRSVTVVAHRGIDADALTKVALAGHPQLDTLLALAGARALAIGDDCAVRELAA